MVARVYAMEDEWREFPDEVGWGSPDVGLVAMGYSNVSVKNLNHCLSCREMPATHFPSGLKLEARTFALKLM